jgi:hypothetical protein
LKLYNVHIFPYKTFYYYFFIVTEYQSDY